jgi:predicted RNA-binding protein with PIN domain
MEKPQRPLVLIDALNVIRHNVSLAQLESRESTMVAAARFIGLCAESIGQSEKWLVVFDGPGDPEHRKIGNSTLEVLYAAALSADEVIIDRARYAMNEGRQVTVVSSDAELVELGADSISAFDFYDRLISRNPVHEPEPERILTSTEICDALKEAGHLSPDFSPSRPLTTDLQSVLDYYQETLSEKASKAAPKIEAALRRHVSVSPEPDPEKSVFRALKKILKTPTG